jgi:hypothetical protein
MSSNLCEYLLIKEEFAVFIIYKNKQIPAWSFFVCCRISEFSLFTLCEYRNHPSEILIPKNSRINNHHQLNHKQLVPLSRCCRAKLFYCESSFFALMQILIQGQFGTRHPKESRNLKFQGKIFNYAPPPDLGEDSSRTRLASSNEKRRHYGQCGGPGIIL